MILISSIETENQLSYCGSTSVNNFEILKNVYLKKTETHFQRYNKKCNKLMNDSCFKAQKEFDKAKQGFVKFPDNMCSQIIFMNIKNSTR